MTIDKLPTAGTYDVFDTACMSKTASFELQQAALKELTARGLTCREVAMQVLQIRMANPMPAPRPLTPYVMPTPQNSYQAPAPMVQSVFGTLVDQQPSRSATGAAAYMCSYRTPTGYSSVIRPITDGPCPPTADLR